MYLSRTRGIVDGFFFDSVCILNDSFDSGDYFPLVSGSSANLVFNLNIYANVFSNTNRTNLTNLLGCDMVYIRGIREIRGQEPAASGNACKSV